MLWTFLSCKTWRKIKLVLKNSKTNRSSESAPILSGFGLFLDTQKHITSYKRGVASPGKPLLARAQTNIGNPYSNLMGTVLRESGFRF
uniref:Uncharacterized protein n=1 Tax=Salix viminalis TaxID=40686 RepID=A0A6N2KSP0_SALVM